MKNYCLRFGLTFSLITLLIASLFFIPLCLALNINVLKIYEILLSILFFALIFFIASFIFFLILGSILFHLQCYKNDNNVIRYGYFEKEVDINKIKTVLIKKLLFIYYVKIKSSDENIYFYFNSKSDCLNCVKKLKIENKINNR